MVVVSMLTNQDPAVRAAPDTRLIEILASFPFLSMKNAKIKIYYYGDDNKLKIEKNLLKILGRTRFEEYLIGNKKRIQLINCKDIK